MGTVSTRGPGTASTRGSASTGTAATVGGGRVSRGDVVTSLPRIPHPSLDFDDVDTLPESAITPIVPRSHPGLCKVDVTTKGPFVPVQAESSPLAKFHVPVELCQQLLEDVWSWTDEAARKKEGILLPARFDPFCESIGRWIFPFARKHLALPTMSPIGGDTKKASASASGTKVDDAWELRLASSYIVRYHPVDHPCIPAHRDTNHVTFNVCIGHQFKGGDLVIYPVEGQQKHLQCAQRVGLGFVHDGELVHQTDPVSRGERVNLIVKFNWQQIDRRIQSFPSWNRLFDNGQRLVLTFLSLPDLSSVLRSSRSLNARASDGSVWRSIYARDQSLCSWISVETLEKDRKVTFEEQTSGRYAYETHYKGHVELSNGEGWMTTYREAHHHWHHIRSFREWSQRAMYVNRRMRMRTGTYTAHMMASWNQIEWKSADDDDSKSPSLLLP